MEQSNVEIQGREAYRHLVRRAAINELERRHQHRPKAWQHLFRPRKAVTVLTDGSTPAMDLQLAENYCRLLGVSLESTFSSDVASEAWRLNRVAERIRLGAVKRGFLPMLHSIALSSWLTGAAVLLPLAIFCVWVAAHSFQVTGIFEMTAISLAVPALLLPVIAPVVFGMEKCRQEKLQMASA